jgi:hypothetical protein
MGRWWTKKKICLTSHQIRSLAMLPCSENRVCLSRGVQVAGAAWRAATMIVAGVGDLMQRTRDGRTSRVLDGWAIGRSGGAVCGLHLACGD